MSRLFVFKPVAQLPSSLTPNAVYFVRAGRGVSMYVADATGGAAHLLNSPVVPQFAAYPYIFGDVNCTALSTVALTANRCYVLPFILAYPVSLSALRISVTTAQAGTAMVGVYRSGVNNYPSQLLLSVSGLSLGTTGDRTGSVTGVLPAHEVLWAAVTGSSAATVRGLALASMVSWLGRVTNSTNAITHLYTAVTGATLPSDLSGYSWTAGTGVVPALYYLLQ